MATDQSAFVPPLLSLRTQNHPPHILAAAIHNNKARTRQSTKHLTHPRHAHRVSQLKLLLVGEGNVGKTSLLVRFTVSTNTDSQITAPALLICHATEVHKHNRRTSLPRLIPTLRARRACSKWATAPSRSSSFVVHRHQQHHTLFTFFQRHFVCGCGVWEQMDTAGQEKFVLHHQRHHQQQQQSLFTRTVLVCGLYVKWRQLSHTEDA